MRRIFAALFPIGVMGGLAKAQAQREMSEMRQSAQNVAAIGGAEKPPGGPSPARPDIRKAEDEL